MRNTHTSETFVRVTVCNGVTKTVSAGKSRSLLEVLRDEGFMVTAPCGGSGRCGKCVVSIKGFGRRRACRFLVEKPLDVKLPPQPKPFILETGSAERRSPLRTPRRVPLNKIRYGLAIDIGTTTVVMYLENLEAKTTIGINSFANPQSAFGNDVISRIHYCMKHTSGLDELRECLIDKVNTSISDLLRRTGVRRDGIVSAAIVGNPAMSHIFLGVNPRSIAFAPFRPRFTELQRKTGGQCRLLMNPAGLVLVLPAVSGFVGSDITAGIASTPMTDIPPYSLYLDIGTNGEIAVGNKTKVWCCSAAAGPAFEGACLDCGVGGIEGAIRSFRNGRYRTIANTKPVGICGSGIVDITAWLLKKGIADTSGYMGSRFVVESSGSTATRRNITVSPADIRQIQLAKAALAAGIRILLNTAGVSIENIEHLFLAGAFGSLMNVKNAAAIGLIPRQLKEKAVPLGNAAGAGARNAVRSARFITRITKVAALSRYVELSGREDFNEEFVKAMGF
jgi:uncharacterized 2Fe-2S/4Fe-4S cluster protein (DUF4445 family)